MQTTEIAYPDTMTPGRRARGRGFAVILHESDFLDAALFRSALRRLSYRAYLVDVWRRMALVRRAGIRVLIGPFLIDQHVSFADRIGLAPFGTLALRRFDDFVTRTCPHTRAWLGEPPQVVLSDLRADVAAISGPARARTKPPVPPDLRREVRRPGPAPPARWHSPQGSHPR